MRQTADGRRLEKGWMASSLFSGSTRLALDSLDCRESTPGLVFPSSHVAASHTESAEKHASSCLHPSQLCVSLSEARHGGCVRRKTRSWGQSLMQRLFAEDAAAVAWHDFLTTSGPEVSFSVLLYKLGSKHPTSQRL